MAKFHEAPCKYYLNEGNCEKAGTEHTDPIVRNAVNTSQGKVMYQDPIRKKRTNGNFTTLKKWKLILKSC